MTHNRLRIVFMGTPDFSVPALRSLIESGHDVVCVYTQPPRPKGRGYDVQKSPIHRVAEEHGIAVRTPKTLTPADAQQDFAALDLDVAVVAAYGLILPQAVLDEPKHGCLNIHASLLPRWRGASPIQRAIWAGDNESGVTIMQMEAGLDTGPMIAKQAIDLTDDMTAQTLHDALSVMGGVMIVDVLDRLAQQGHALQAEPQDDSLSRYAKMLSRDDGRIDWNNSAGDIERQMRALTPWPGVWCLMPNGERLKILAVTVQDDTTDQKPGTVLNKHCDVACGDHTVLRLIKVHPANRKQMEGSAFINGGFSEIGARLI